MIMFDQALVSICALKYLESYLDCMENLPEDIQRVISQVMELDIQSQDLVSSFPESDDIVVSPKDEIVKIQKQLVQLQALIDEKLSCVSQIQEAIDQKMQVLEDGRDNHEDAKKQKLSLPEKQPKPHIAPPAATTPAAAVTPATSHTRSNSVSSHSAPKAAATSTNANHNKTNNARQAAATTVITPSRESTSATTPVSEHKPGAKRLKRGKIEEIERPERTVAVKRSLDDSSEDSGSMRKKRKRKMGGKQGGRGSQRGDESGFVDNEIDPDEPTYCVCKNISYGEMVCCDNDRCTIEWFHFNCVALAAKPKGKWYCPSCRGDSAKVLRKDVSRK